MQSGRRAQSSRGGFLGWGWWGFLAQELPGSVAPKPEGWQPSGALPLLLHPCFFPVMCPGRTHPVTSRNCYPGCCPGHPSASSSRDKCCPGTSQAGFPSPRQRGHTLSRDHTFPGAPVSLSMEPEVSGSLGRSSLSRKCLCTDSTLMFLALSQPEAWRVHRGLHFRFRAPLVQGLVCRTIHRALAALCWLEKGEKAPNLL